MNKQVVEITEEDKNIRCDYCQLSTVNSLEWGPLYSYAGVTVHYFCMLFSAGLSQNGDDDQGILGFLPNDIRKELKRGDKLKCKFCKNSRATIGCSVKTCKYSYHYPCGLQAKCVFHFIGNFESYCHHHKEILRIPLPKDEWECPICFTEVTEEELPLWPPCCKKRVFHKRCIMEMAKNHGAHFFKCPLCNDKEDFSIAMRKSGVYLPDRDATWETANMFEDHTRLYSRCDAEECHCPKGREHNSKSENKPWKVVRCGACGASAVHKFCGKLKNLTWRCETCNRILSDKRKSDVVNSIRIQRHHFETSSDEELEESSQVTRISEVISAPPTFVSSESRTTDLHNFIQSQPRAAMAYPFFRNGRTQIVVDDDEEDSGLRSSSSSGSSDESDNNADDDRSDSDDSDIYNPVFISSEAKEKLRQSARMEAKIRVERKASKPNSTSGSISRLTLPVSADSLTQPPSFPPLEKGTLISTRVEKISSVQVQAPEIISESENRARVKISLNGISGVRTPTANKEFSSNVESIVEDQDVDIMQTDGPCHSVKDISDIVTVDLDADENSSDSEIEVISEKVAPTAVTKSSTLMEILKAAHGHGTNSKHVNPPVVRLGVDDNDNDRILLGKISLNESPNNIFSRLPFRPAVPISNAFLSMIKQVKEKQRNKTENNAKKIVQEVVELDSDDDLAGPSYANSNSGNATVSSENENSAKKRATSPTPSSGFQKRSRI